jgi:hypothetical protein
VRPSSHGLTHHSLTTLLQGQNSNFLPCAGFYQIVTCVEAVYDVALPANIREVLRAVQFTISFGIEAIPLACLGASGYLARLILWQLVPLILITLIICVRSALLLWQSQFVGRQLMQAVAPFALRIVFLTYPFITNISFEAFSCYHFDDGTKWLITDVSIECGTAQHERVKAFAWAAVVIYPVGCFLLNSYLLLTARGDILQERRTLLTRAISFCSRSTRRHVSHGRWLR